jgi:hypothetical protein
MALAQLGKEYATSLLFICALRYQLAATVIEMLREFFDYLRFARRIEIQPREPPTDFFFPFGHNPLPLVRSSLSLGFCSAFNRRMTNDQ